MSVSQYLSQQVSQAVSKLVSQQVIQSTSQSVNKSVNQSVSQAIIVHCCLAEGNLIMEKELGKEAYYILVHITDHKTMLN